jgi:ubiquinone biosynthesis monooxygenase Coq7
LDDHLNDLPPNDTISRAIVAQMRADEIEHGRMAIKEGGIELPQAIQSIMRMMAKAMTLTAYRI